MYAVLIYLLGMHALSAEFAEMGRVVTVLTLLLANICMILVDRLLTMVRKKR
jgi:amino acid permease